MEGAHERDFHVKPSARRWRRRNRNHNPAIEVRHAHLYNALLVHRRAQQHLVLHDVEQDELQVQRGIRCDCAAVARMRDGNGWPCGVRVRLALQPRYVALEPRFVR